MRQLLSMEDLELKKKLRMTETAEDRYRGRPCQDPTLGKLKLNLDFATIQETGDARLFH